MEGSTHKGPRSSNLDYSITASVHEGLASLWVDLHEVGNLLARTNFLVQLHNTKKEAAKRHLTNLGGTTLQKVIDVVTMMNSLLLCFKRQSPSHRFGLVEEVDWVESNLGRL